MYPNPFVTSATLEFFLHEKSPIQIEWCEMNGKKIRTITEGNFDAGRHGVVLTRESLPSGIYLIRLATDAGLVTRKIILQ